MPRFDTVSPAQLGAQGRIRQDRLHPYLFMAARFFFMKRSLPWRSRKTEAGGYTARAHPQMAKPIRQQSTAAFPLRLRTPVRAEVRTRASHEGRKRLRGQRLHEIFAGIVLLFQTQQKINRDAITTYCSSNSAYSNRYQEISPIYRFTRNLTVGHICSTSKCSVSSNRTNDTNTTSCQCSTNSSGTIISPRRCRL